MAVLKFSFFLFFIPTEPVIWLVVLCSFRKTKQSHLQILRAFWAGQRGQERLWELEFVITRKRGRRSADQKARRLWVRGT